MEARNKREELRVREGERGWKMLNAREKKRQKQTDRQTDRYKT